MKLVFLVLAVLTSVAAADDNFTKITDGAGFPGIASVGMPTPEIVKNLGRPPENIDFMFWYFYREPDFDLTVINESHGSGTNTAFTARAIVVEGSHAPPTSLGARIGMPVERLKNLYGEGEPYDGPLASRQYPINGDRVTGIYYRRLGMLFVLADNKISKIVAIHLLPKTTGKHLALVMDQLDNYDAALSVSVNGLPVVHGYPYEYPTSGQPYLPIPEYLLHTGENVIAIQFSEINPKPKHDLDLRLVELSDVDKQTVAVELAHITSTKTPFSDAYLFEVTSAQRHKYLTSPQIKPAMETTLKQDAAALVYTWNRQKRLTTKLEENQTHLARWLANPRLTLELADDSAMAILPGGQLAHLVSKWRIVGGAHDAPAGQMGPVDIELDIWFHLDAHDNFVPAAVFQIGPAPEHL